jgi:hypothetical protein
MGDCLMATLKINGDTSGYVELVSPAVAGSTSIELDKILVSDSSGNVGIGIDSPGNTLHVTSAGHNTYSSTVTKGINHTGLSIVQEGGNTDMTGVFFGSGGSGSGSHWSSITGSRTAHASHWGTQLNFYTHDNDTANLADATQKMIITGDGNVGIGTTNPDAKMHLYTGAGTTLFKAEVNANSTVGMEIKKTGSTTQSWRIVDGQTVNGALQFYDVTDSRVSMQIDGTGALLVGKTAANFANAGTEINASGRVFITYDGGGPLQLNRKTSHGDIIELHKDGVEHGSIGSGGSELVISTPSGIPYISQKLTGDTDGVQYSNSGTYHLGPWISKNDTIDLGRSNAGWRDLYLTGGIQFDSRSNKLDDYEEGTWAPVISVENAGPASITVNHATYTKVGRLVSLVFELTINSVTGTNSSRAIQLTGMPFVINTASGGGPNIAYSNLTNSMTGNLALQGRLNSRYRIVNLNGATGLNASDHLQANTVLRGQFTYHTDQ